MGRPDEVGDQVVGQQWAMGGAHNFDGSVLVKWGFGAAGARLDVFNLVTMSVNIFVIINGVLLERQ